MGTCKMLKLLGLKICFRTIMLRSQELVCMYVDENDSAFTENSFYFISNRPILASSDGITITGHRIISTDPKPTVSPLSLDVGWSWPDPYLSKSAESGIVSQSRVRSSTVKRIMPPEETIPFCGIGVRTCVRSNRNRLTNNDAVIKEYLGSL